MFGLTMFEGAAVLGEAPVYADGSWLANVPPYIPMHLQPIDKFGLAIRNQQLWIQAHAGRDSAAASAATSRAPARACRRSARTRRSPSSSCRCTSFTEPIPDRTEFPWNTKVQTDPRFEVRQLPQLGHDELLLQ